MNYWTKKPKSSIKISGLNYNKASQRLELKRLLLAEQKGFCAYSERYIQNTDAHDVEHFDPRLKETEADNYENWYAVLNWINTHKPKNLDERFLPILHPKNVKKGRIWYENGIFKAEQSDIEAKNLIKFLGLNKPELYADRESHIAYIRSLREICGNDSTLFLEQLRSFPQNLSFITALEHEFNFVLQGFL